MKEKEIDINLDKIYCQFKQNLVLNFSSSAILNLIIFNLLDYVTNYKLHIITPLDSSSSAELGGWALWEGNCPPAHKSYN